MLTQKTHRFKRYFLLTDIETLGGPVLAGSEVECWGVQNTGFAAGEYNCSRLGDDNDEYITFYVPPDALRTEHHPLKVYLLRSLDGIIQPDAYLSREDAEQHQEMNGAVYNVICLDIQG